MAQLGDDDFDQGVEASWRLFAANLDEIANTISTSRAGAAQPNRSKTLLRNSYNETAPGTQGAGASGGVSGLTLVDG
jgi:hypothetical protein